MEHDNAATMQMTPALEGLRAEVRFLPVSLH